ncbi:trypsin-like serine peptidase [Halomonas daqiaonensis]|uniref:V8-like Glu-specific endopeptidase n=1 Tax=Halomonas daqiaonensis TaxID=650850 RepID=A0A1H7QXQ4_9GAMM|nr:hypothetical protein [Halomonas daqiaonensis]SEL52498.1 V8-like Glu-specific endopeptidase [Halomonas daqiaonensis]
MRQRHNYTTSLIAAAVSMSLGLPVAFAQNQDDQQTTFNPQLEMPSIQTPQINRDALRTQPKLQSPDLHTMPEMDPEGPGRKEISMNELPEWLVKTPLIQDISKQSFVIDRPRRTSIDTQDMQLMPSVEFDNDEDIDEERLTPPDLGELRQQARLVDFEFYDMGSGRSFQVVSPRARLAAFAREVNELVDETNPEGKPVSDEMIEQESRIEKAWSNRTDNRIRRAIADGFSDRHSIYQRIADYGGCSANVLVANSRRMIAITAAHCVFTSSGNISNASIRPRRDGGTSPTWGSWSVYGYGYYPQFLNNNCDSSFSGGCIRHDIALIFARPDRGATPPAGMGWGYRRKGFLNGHNAYRRGYPGCGSPHSPSGCTTNALYGDGDVFNRFFAFRDSDGWPRQFRFSSDTNPGDSGSGLYYYRNGYPYVYGVTSAERNCRQNCRGRTPSFGRRITPEFFDFINSVR